MNYPVVRGRRLRRSKAIRDLLTEVSLTPAHLIYPMFIVEGRNQRRPIATMPGIYQQSVDNALIEIHQALSMGVKAIMLFGVPDEKDPQATSGLIEHGVVQQAVRQIRAQFGEDVVLMTDTCLCEYTNHGHCGIVMEQQVLNDPSVEVLAQMAVSQAQAGADVVCPSDMMDGRVQAIRWALDEAGYTDTAIMAYAVKYASSLYSPFREAADSAPEFGDRRSYQMDYRRSKREALLELEQDELEGADMLMIKPALAYLDVIQAAYGQSNMPLVAYNVSGEYSMVKAAAAQGWIDEQAVVTELLTGMRRAGANLIATYHALDAAQWLNT